MSPEDRLRIGWEEIAESFRRPVVTVQGWKKEMLDAGVIYYDIFGVPPNRREQVCGFESDLRRWRKEVVKKARRKSKQELTYFS